MRSVALEDLAFEPRAAQTQLTPDLPGTCVQNFLTDGLGTLNSGSETRW